MTKDEALKLALEALEESKTNNDTMEFHDRKNKAITAIKQALAAPVQEPVGYVAENGVVDWNVCAPPILTDLYTTPPAAQRQWVGLTDEEFEDIELGCRSTSFGKIEAMQKVEAKLKEKNNG